MPSAQPSPSTSSSTSKCPGGWEWTAAGLHLPPQEGWGGILVPTGTWGKGTVDVPSVATWSLAQHVPLGVLAQASLIFDGVTWSCPSSSNEALSLLGCGQSCTPEAEGV